ncbi:hypothetical protein [Acinetobacter pittii]|uniref:hypothetical protein n=1 Tax=Acinetobacter pittii TaxID=48296 RepID=UPI0019022A33|nr:hypothetical protein [Acinetobacter pittii]MBJ8470320.1 hypothetical protein [Acinetobacter pittii]
MTDLNKERELYRAAKARIEKEEFFCRDWDLWKACAELKQEEINTLRADLVKAKAQTVPEGCVVVPKQPTPKMIDATWDFDDEIIEMSSNTRNEFIWKKMVEASESRAEK